MKPAQTPPPPVPFYPILLATFPILSVYSANLAYVPTGELWRPLGAVIALTAALWLVSGLVLRSAARGAAATTTAVLCLFGFSWFASLVRDPTWYWIASALLVGLAAWRLTNTKILNVLGLAITAIALSNLTFGLIKANRLSHRATGGIATGTQTNVRPDVFYVILDGHGRSDAIKRAIGFDNRPFIEGLRQRGFYVADKSHSNYCQTELSLSSSLNMDFIPTLLPEIKPTELERTPLGRLIDDNEVARRFRAEGYRYVAVTTGFPPVRLASADVHLGMESSRSMIESALISMTPFGRNEDDVRSQFLRRRDQLLAALNNLGSLGTPTPSPRFIVAHILAPHPPFVFGPNGGELTHHGPFGYMDGSDFIMNVGGPADYRRGYSGQVAFIEKQVLAAVDRILAAEGPSRRPIIIIQGDHGSKVGLDQASEAKTDMHEVFPILNAYLVPDAIRAHLRPDITPVNSFRLLLTDLFGENLPPLPDRSWYSTFPLPYAFTEETNRIEPVVGTKVPRT